MSDDNKRPAAATAGDSAAWLDLVTRQVRDLRFGVVQIVVHDGRVVQIERSERVRLAPVGRGGD